MDKATSGFRLEGIEALRAFAALSIVIVHIIVLGNISLPKELSFIPSYFGLGVMLFFVVSGFGLTYGYIGRIKNSNDLSEYYIRRFARIAPLFYFMIALYVVLAYNGIGHKISPSDFLLNALFLFNLVPSKAEGIVSASWTIGVEMLVYLVFPLLINLCKSLKTSIVALIASIALGYQFSNYILGEMPSQSGYAGSNVITNLPFFIFGICGYHIYSTLREAKFISGQKTLSYAIWALIFLASFGVVNGWFGSYSRIPARYQWGAIFSAICVAVSLHPTWLISNATTKYIGKISFSLYLLHPIFLYWMGVFGVYKYTYSIFDSVMLGFITSVAVSVVVIVAASALTFNFIEKPGMILGRKIGKSVYNKRERRETA
ncbi:acyltransferase [Pseudomonas syringae]|nr:acyltransferase [Pseudomonas syringae]